MGTGATVPEQCRDVRRDKIARRANQFRFTEIVSSPKIKNISLYPKTNQWHILGHPVPLRGALAIVTTRGGDAVDADVATDERD
jgi:hypothetical protein